MKNNTTKVSTKTPATKTTASNYVAVSKNVYFDGKSYRTRVTVDGICNSKSFPSKRKAVEYRNQLLAN